MGYTRYWQYPTCEYLKPFCNEFVTDTIAVLEHFKKQHSLCGADGYGYPIVTNTIVTFNGSAEKNQEYETFVLDVNKNSWFCKTAQRPYDAVVLAVLCLAEKYHIIDGFYDDGFVETSVEWVNDTFDALNIDFEVLDNDARERKDALGLKYPQLEPVLRICNNTELFNDVADEIDYHFDPNVYAIWCEDEGEPATLADIQDNFLAYHRDWFCFTPEDLIDEIIDSNALLNHSWIKIDLDQLARETGYTYSEKENLFLVK